MKHKTWFRLVLKATGVYLFMSGVSALLTYIGFVLPNVISSAPFSFQFPYQFAGPIFQVGAGLYLFFGGEWVVNKAIPSNRPYCPECGYDLSGAVSCRCPECDTPFDPERVRPSALAMPDDDADDGSERDDLA